MWTTNDDLFWAITRPLLGWKVKPCVEITWLEMHLLFLGMTSHIFVNCALMRDVRRSYAQKEKWWDDTELLQTISRSFWKLINWNWCPWDSSLLEVGEVIANYRLLTAFSRRICCLSQQEALSCQITSGQYGKNLCKTPWQVHFRSSNLDGEPWRRRRSLLYPSRQARNSNPSEKKEPLELISALANK